MRNFLLGVITAALAAFLAYVGQSYWDDYKKSGSYSLEHVEYTPSLVLPKETTSRWLKQSESAENRDLSDGVKITLFEVENTGDEALTDQLVRISPTSREFVGSGVIGFQDYSVPGGDDQGTQAALEDKSLVIRYNLFNPGDTHVLWVFSDRYTDLEVIARRSGLSVQGWTVGVSSWNSEEENDYIGSILFYLVVIFLGFIAGAILDAVVTKRMLLNRGHNLTKLLADPIQKQSTEPNDSG